MARIRTIKPSFWSDDDVVACTRDARLTMLGLVSFADDEGRFIASTAAVLGYVYPHDNIRPARLRQWLRELESRGLLHLYEVDGRAYGAFLKWHRHQRISHPQPSTLPAPQGELFHA